MSALRTAIYNKFIADVNAPLYIDLGGADRRFYYDEAPQTPTYPYCVFSLLTEDFSFQFTEEFENTFVQFDYYSQASGPDTCDDGVADIKTMFDWTDLTIAGYLFLQMERQFSLPAQKVQPENVWQGIVRYEILAQDT